MLSLCSHFSLAAREASVSREAWMPHNVFRGSIEDLISKNIPSGPIEI